MVHRRVPHGEARAVRRDARPRPCDKPPVADVPIPPPPGDARGLAGLRAAWRAVAAALAFRGACYAAMIAAAVWNELRPAPTVPDLVLAHLPYVAWVARTNYLVWLAAYLPLSLALLWLAPRTFARYTVTAGLVSLARGGTLVLTGLGAPDPSTAGPGIAGHAPLAGWRVATTGVGAIAAAVATARLLAEQRPARVLLVGTCGAYDGRLVLGDLLLASPILATSQDEVEGRAYRPELERTRWEATWTPLALPAYPVAVPPAITTSADGARRLAALGAAPTRTRNGARTTRR